MGHSLGPLVVDKATRTGLKKDADSFVFVGSPGADSVNAAHWKRIVKPLVDEQWGIHKHFVYLKPVDWVLRGVLHERSSRSGVFYMWVMRFPLVVPVDHVTLSHSERFGGGSMVWDDEIEKARPVVAQAMQIIELEHLTEPRFYVEPPSGIDGHQEQEERAYGLLVEGDAQRASEILGRVVRSWSSPRYEWEFDVLRRVNMMRALLSEGHVDEAVANVKQWRSYTLEALGIDHDALVV